MDENQQNIVGIPRLHFHVRVERSWKYDLNSTA